MKNQTFANNSIIKINSRFPMNLYFWAINVRIQKQYYYLLSRNKFSKLNVDASGHFCHC